MHMVTIMKKTVAVSFLSPVRRGKFDRHLLSFYCAISKLSLCFDYSLGWHVQR